jgi:hypothetical protein
MGDAPELALVVAVTSHPKPCLFEMLVILWFGNDEKHRVFQLVFQIVCYEVNT